jgi:hypothetical protein
MSDREAAGALVGALLGASASTAAYRVYNRNSDRSSQNTGVILLIGGVAGAAIGGALVATLFPLSEEEKAQRAAYQNQISNIQF